MTQPPSPAQPPTAHPQRRQAARADAEIAEIAEIAEQAKVESPAQWQHKTLITLLTLVTVAFVLIVLPFYGALMWGAIIGLLFAPLFRWLQRRMGGRPNLAAAAALGIVLLMVVLPMLLIAAALAQETTRLVQAVQSGQIDFGSYLQRIVAWLPGPVTDLLDRLGLNNAAAIQKKLGEGAGKMGQYVAGQLLDIGTGTFNAMVSFFVALYVAFFMLRDGSKLVAQIRDALPLPRRDKAELGATFSTVVRATVKGNLVVALVQGVLGGLALWVLGVGGALLMGALMAMTSLLPSVGAALVWFPVALYLLATGAVWKGVVLIAFGTLVIGLVDNLLRPLLVGKDTRLPDWLVLITTIGGMALLGINGFVIGPVVAAMFVAVWALVGTRSKERGGAQMAADAAVTGSQKRPRR